jgi:YidC/Oxa1 family membrane protein insertase
LGRDFNLLPLITVALFIVQQKMFTPPPADEQQAMQFKMMNYMMVFMGFMFYHVPAGLCVYFIASSLWGMGERKMLDLGDPKPPAPAGSEPPPKKVEETSATATTPDEAAGNGAALADLRARRKERRRSRT